jgi:hypothetical protein
MDRRSRSRLTHTALQTVAGEPGLGAVRIVADHALQGRPGLFDGVLLVLDEADLEQRARHLGAGRIEFDQPVVFGQGGRILAQDIVGLAEPVAGVVGVFALRIAAQQIVEGGLGLLVLALLEMLEALAVEIALAGPLGLGRGQGWNPSTVPGLAGTGSVTGLPDGFVTGGASSPGPLASTTPGGSVDSAVPPPSGPDARPVPASRASRSRN